ncbi:ATP-binding protein [Calditrichota bacterium GD2]
MTQAKIPERFKNIYRIIYLNFFFIALVITALIVYWQKGGIKPNRLYLVDHISFSSQNNSKDYYHDFDHDGFSEKISFEYRRDTREIEMRFFAEEKKATGQWNFSGKWLVGAVYFADYDGDAFDETYFFTKANDSLFLYSIDPRKRNQFLLYRQFLATAPRPNPHPRKIWDLRKPEMVFFDADNDGYQECFINLVAYYSLQPRALIRFDIDQRKITARTPDSGAYIVGPTVVDLDGDGIPEILMKKCIAFETYRSPFPYKDNNAYLMVFDKDLNFFFEPKVFPYYSSRIKNIPYSINNRAFIVTSYSYNGHLNINPKIYLYNRQGRKLREKIFPIDERIYPFIITRNNHEQLYFLSRTSGNILKPNFNLDIVETIKPELPISDISRMIDLDGDLKEEIFCRTKKGRYAILSHDFKYMYTLPPLRLQNMTVNFVARGKAGHEILIKKRNELYRFKFASNPLYGWRYLLFFILNIIIYFILLGIFLAGQKASSILLVHKNLFQFTQNGLCIINHRAKITYVNGNFERHLYLSKHIDKNAPLFESLEERPIVIEFAKTLMAQRVFQEKEINLRTNQGVTPILLRGSVIKGVLKIPAGFLIETVLQRSKVTNQKLEIWTNTVQKMAHDIKTPLTTVQLLTQGLRLRLKEYGIPDQTPIEKDFSTIEQELSRIREMTRHFLRFTNLGKPNLQWTSLQEIANRLLEKFAVYLKDGLQIKLELDKKYDRCLVDPALLEMVFQIIIENSIDAMASKGVILISSTVIEKIEENFKRYLEIEIVDNGPGIDPSVINQVFDPFFTTKENGTGMGLTLAKKIIDDHEGKIDIWSVPGKSTHVKILLPYKEEFEEDQAADR